MAPMFPFPITGKHFIGPEKDQLIQRGFRPNERIVPAWFGFRTQLETVPEHCEIEVTARSQYKLFVNGESLLFGPCRSEKEVAYYDTIDIAPQLKIGENYIVLQVLSYPEHPADRAQMGPNYCYGDDDGPSVSLETVGGQLLGNQDPGDPENWVIWLDTGMAFNNENVFLTGAMEVVDGAVNNPLLVGRFDAPELIPAVHVQPITYDPFGCRHGKVFKKRPIPLLYRLEKSIPGWEQVTVPAHEKTSFVLDAGQLTTAYFRIGFAGGKSAKVRLTYAESYYKQDEEGRRYKGVRDDSTGFIFGMHDDYVVGEDGIYEPFRFRTFRFIEVSVETADAPLTILPQPYIETAYPLHNVKKPAFTDPAREKMYDVAFRTLQLCAHDTYEDCPYYEQLMYACDTRLEMLFTYAATDDVELPRQAIRLFAASLQSNGFTQARFPSREDQIIPLFALYFPLMLTDYVDETGDIDFIRRYIPIAERIVENFLDKRCADGLLAPQGYWDYFDWTKEWAAADWTNTPTALKNGESALMNLFYVYAVQNLCRILPQFGRADLAAAYEAECQDLLHKVHEVCYIPEKGLIQEGPNTVQYTQHSQVYAVLTGLFTGEEAREVMEKVLNDQSLILCSFMQKYYIFKALEMTGMQDRGEELWAAWQEFIDLHCTTFPETPFDPRSDCHGWSALPLLYLK